LQLYFSSIHSGTLLLSAAVDGVCICTYTRFSCKKYRVLYIFLLPLLLFLKREIRDNKYESFMANFAEKVLLFI
jgi:hypothetical protein